MLFKGAMFRLRKFLVYEVRKQETCGLHMSRFSPQAVEGHHCLLKCHQMKAVSHALWKHDGIEACSFPFIKIQVHNLLG
jgi:hypothetical protein